MNCKILSTEEFSPILFAEGSAATLRCYCRAPHGDSPMPAVIILPGGAYMTCGGIEAEPAALAFVGEGFQAFVLEYSVKPHKYPRQLLEAAAAVAYVRRAAERYFVDPDRIAVCGFSAGGHLAGVTANLWNTPVVSSRLREEASLCRPNAAVLCYPFVSRALGSNVLGNIGVGEGDFPELSLDRSVTPDTPPCFIWHTADDPVVSSRHSLLFAEALSRHDIPFELHIYGHGPHIMSTATALSAISPAHIDPHVATWIPLCSEWLKTLAFGG